MEADWVAKRSLLRHLITLHPTWTVSDFATCLGHSESWVKKWRKRFREADPDDPTILLSHSRARKTPPPSTSPEVIQRILELRDSPPEHLQRVPGPKALLYYLPRHAEGLPQGAHLPAPRARFGRFCATTIGSWKIVVVSRSLWSRASRCKKSKSISKMTRPCLLIHWASASMW